MRNIAIIELLCHAGIGKFTDRNSLGKTPIEVPHNDALNMEGIPEIVEEFYKDRTVDDGIITLTEPDYIFVCDSKRVVVLSDQLDVLNDRLEEKEKMKKDEDKNERRGLLKHDKNSGRPK
jgi:hypothetical protein